MRKKLLSNWKKNLNWRIYESNVFECRATRPIESMRLAYVLMINRGDVRPFKVSTVNYFAIVRRKLIRKTAFWVNFDVFSADGISRDLFPTSRHFCFHSFKQQMCMSVKWRLVMQLFGKTLQFESIINQKMLPQNLKSLEFST